jgi:hypothetical protein
MAPFTPGKGGGKGIGYGRKNKGVLIHSFTNGAGMPLSMRTMPANGDELAQVIPLLDALHIRTGKRGRPRKRLKVLATDKEYDAKHPRHRLRTRGSQPQISQRGWKSCKPRGRPINQDVPRFQVERTVAGFQRKSRRWVARWHRIAACFNALLAMAMLHMWVQKPRRG